MFEGSAAYEPEIWTMLATLREDAAAGGTFEELKVEQAELFEAWRQMRSDLDGDPGFFFESGLILLQYVLNAGYPSAPMPDTSPYPWDYVTSWASDDMCEALADAPEDPETQAILSTWAMRAYLLDNYDPLLTSSFADQYMDKLLHELDRGATTIDRIFDSPFMDGYSPERKALLLTDIEEYRALLAFQVHLCLDGNRFWTCEETSEIQNGRTLAPVRITANGLGAQVTWVQEDQQAILERAGTTVVMTLGDPIAYVNGSPVDMGVEPYADNGTIYIPVRFIGEFFGQIVTWDAETRTANITEDKSVAGDSNLEEWAVAMTAYTAYSQGAPIFGLYERVSYRVGDARYYLEGNWGITSREALIDTIGYMTYFGHNFAFLMEAALEGDDAWRFTRTLYDKWGDRGVLCWDLFRVSRLAQQGYIAGYVTYAEALALVEPAVRLLQENFSSWREAYENDLDGYNWWRREDATGEDPWDFGVGFSYTNMMNDEKYAALLDDDMFSREVIPVPNLTIEDLLAEISGG